MCSVTAGQAEVREQLVIVITYQLTTVLKLYSIQRTAGDVNNNVTADDCLEVVFKIEQKFCSL